MKAACCLVALLIAGPASAQSTLGLAPATVLVVGSSLDLATSLEALHSGLGQEGNPFLAHVGTPGLVLWKVGATAGLLVVCQRIAGAGHPRWAQGIAYAVGAGLTGLAAHNRTVGR